MPKRRINKLVALEFKVLRREGFVDAYKCSCGNMEKYVEYKTALNHANRCEKCLRMQARMQNSRSNVSEVVQCAVCLLGTSLCHSVVERQ
jgi:hypothetical protein